MKEKIYLLAILGILASACSNKSKQIEEELIPIGFSTSGTGAVENNGRVKHVNAETYTGSLQTKTSIDKGDFKDISFEIEKQDPVSTKVSWTNASTAVLWVAGDSVGFYMRRSTGVADPYIDRNNVLYKAATSGAATTLSPVLSRLYYPYLATNNVNIYGYYPYATFPAVNTSPVQYASAAAINSTTLSCVVPTNQSTPSSCDLLYTSALNLNRNSVSPVNTVFSHAYVCIEFSIISVTFSGKALTKVSLSGSKVTNAATLDLTTAALTTNTASTFLPYSNVNLTLDSFTPVYVRLFINPCSIGINIFGSELKVYLTINGNVYSTSIVSFTTLSSGDKCNVYLAI